MSSSDRSSNPNRPVKPLLASTRTARSPITPRVAASSTTSTRSAAAAAPHQTPSVRSQPPTPRVKQTTTPVNDALANGNITPRSSARTSKSGSSSVSPINATRPKLISAASSDKSGAAAKQDRAPLSRPRSLLAGNGKAQSPLLTSPLLSPVDAQSTADAIDAQFFHASDAPKHEPTSRKPEPQKKSQFFHADGKQDTSQPSPGATSSMLFAVSEQRSSGPWISSADGHLASAISPLLSPSLSAISSTSPFFATGALPARQPSPTQSKENIHLSYRKGASQIFGTRPHPKPRSNASGGDNAVASGNAERARDSEPSTASLARHHKSASLSSIDSGSSITSRRKTSVHTETEPVPATPQQSLKPTSISSGSRVPYDLPSIDTSLESQGIPSRTDSSLSPTKHGHDLAAEARRERKVLDLEISNSSLLAINASLEREVRRQKTELKRFRRLSRAGRFSFAPGDRMRTLSDDLTVLNEDDEDEDEDLFGLPSGSLNQDDASDDDESVISSTGPLSPSAQDRLAKDERRLRIDLEKHKELLSQSQAMNQSIKRCMYATEEMIREGRKALEYRVQVSEVSLGGRVLSTYEDTDDHQEMETEVGMMRDQDADNTHTFSETWPDVARPSYEGSKKADRDSGIEVERHSIQSLPVTHVVNVSGNGRPTTLRDLGKFGSFS